LRFLSNQPNTFSHRKEIPLGPSDTTKKKAEKEEGRENNTPGSLLAHTMITPEHHSDSEISQAPCSIVASPGPSSFNGRAASWNSCPTDLEVVGFT